MNRGNTKSQIKLAFLSLIIIILFSIIALANFTLNTDKETYSTGEKVNILVSPNDASKTFRIIGPDDEFVTGLSEFTPLTPGAYAIFATLSKDGKSEKLSTSINVVGTKVNGAVKINGVESATELANLKSKIQNANVKSVRKNNLKFDVDVDSKDGRSKIRFNGLNNAEDLHDVKTVTNYNKKVKVNNEDAEITTDAVYVNVTAIDSADITLTKTTEVNTILYCADEEFTNDCISGWVDSGLHFVDNNDGTITFTVTHFTTYAGGYVNLSQNISLGVYNYAQNVNGTVSLLNNFWTRKNDAPISRKYTSMVYDSKNKLIIVYGGLTGGSTYSNSTWVYNISNDSWTQKADGPSARAYHKMVYDSKDGVVIMYGGMNGSLAFNDTWAYNLSNNLWTQKTIIGPSNRLDHAMAYDYDNNLIFMYGGSTFNWNSEFQDSWIYNLSNDSWTQKANFGGHFGVTQIDMDYDSVNKVMITYGGRYWLGGNHFPQETWIYNFSNNAWTQKNYGPLMLQSYNIVYDPIKKVMVMVGGNVGNAYDTNTSYFYNLSSDSWTNNSDVSFKPKGSGMVYDIYNDLFVSYGGVNSLAQTWTYKMRYATSGNYAQIINLNQTVVWSGINFTNSTPQGTNITYQIAANNDNTTWNFIGPDGTANTYYDQSGQTLNITPSRYFKYIFYLSTTNFSVSPTVSNISVKYYYPNPTFTTGVSNISQVLVWDDSDSNNYYTNLTIYANFTNFTSGISIKNRVKELSPMLFFQFNNDSNYGENSSVVYDYSGNGNNGIVTGAVWNSSGRFSGAYQFNATSYIKVITELNHSGNYSAFIWVKWNTLNAWDALISKNDWAIGGPAQFQLQLDNTLKLYGYAGGNGGTGAQIPTNYNSWVTGTWYFIGYTVFYDGANSNATFYVNGNNIYSGTAVGKTYNAVANLTIMSSVDGTADEVTIWNRTLNSSEITELYNHGYCEFQKNSTGSWSAPVSMNYNSSNGLYFYNLLAGFNESSYNVVCQAPGFDTVNVTETANSISDICTQNNIDVILNSDYSCSNVNVKLNSLNISSGAKLVLNNVNLTVGKTTVYGAFEFHNSKTTLWQNNNLTIMAGGSYLLDNSTLRMNTTSDGQFGIEVYGTMTIANNSNITTGSQAKRYLFRVYPSANFSLKDSFVNYVGNGAAATGNYNLSGLWINTNNTIISNNTISTLNSLNDISVIYYNSNNNIFNNNNINSNTSQGINLLNSNYNNITNNNFNGKDGFYVITFTTSNNNSLILNNITGVSTFTSSNYINFTQNNVYSYIYLSSSNNNNFILNTVYPNGYKCVDLNGASSNIFKDNNMSTNSQACVHFDTSTNNNNIFINNTISSTYNNFGAIYITSTATNNYFVNNTISGSSYRGILISTASASYNNFTSNNIYSNSGYALEIQSTSNNRFTNNNISSNSICTYINSASYNIFTNNTINSIGLKGLLLISSSYNLFDKNNITASGAGFAAVDIYSSSPYNNFTNNLMESTTNGQGVSAQGANTIYLNNNIKSNTGTALLLDSANNIFTNNNITSTANTATTIASGSNIFINNTFSSANGYYDISSYATPANNYIINSNLNKSKFNITVGAIFVQWYVDILVQNLTFDNLTGVTVSAYYPNGTREFTNQTTATGFISTQTVTEFMQNASGKYMQTPKFVSNISGYALNTFRKDITQSQQITVTLGNAGLDIWDDIKLGNTNTNAVTIYANYTNITRGVINSSSTELLVDSAMKVLYHFNNNSNYGENSTKVYDFSSNGNNLTCSVSCPTFNSTGKINGAYYFNGISNYLEANDANSLEVNTEFTISSWINKKGTGNQVIVAKWSASNLAYDFGLNPSNQIVGTISSDCTWNGPNGLNSWAITSDTSVTNNNWYYVTLTFNSGTLKVYINGVLDKTRSGVSTSVCNFGNTPLRIGRDGDDASPFNGSIDEVAIWNRTLSASEIQNIYSTKSCEFKTNATGSWATSTMPFDSASGLYKTTIIPLLTNFSYNVTCSDTSYDTITNTDYVTGANVFTCDQGDVATTCNITTIKNITTNNYVISANNLIIKNGGVLQSPSGTLSFTLNLTGNLTIESSGKIENNVVTSGDYASRSPGNISINANTILIYGDINSKTSCFSGNMGCNQGRTVKSFISTNSDNISIYGNIFGSAFLDGSTQPVNTNGLLTSTEIIINSQTIRLNGNITTVSYTGTSYSWPNEWGVIKSGDITINGTNITINGTIKTIINSTNHQSWTGKSTSSSGQINITGTNQVDLYGNIINSIMLLGGNNFAGSNGNSIMFSGLIIIKSNILNQNAIINNDAYCSSSSCNYNPGNSNKGNITAGGININATILQINNNMSSRAYSYNDSGSYGNVFGGNITITTNQNNILFRTKLNVSGSVNNGNIIFNLPNYNVSNHGYDFMSNSTYSSAPWLYPDSLNCTFDAPGVVAAFRCNLNGTLNLSDVGINNTQVYVLTNNQINFSSLNIINGRLNITNIKVTNDLNNKGTLTSVNITANNIINNGTISITANNGLINGNNLDNYGRINASTGTESFTINLTGDLTNYGNISTIVLSYTSLIPNNSGNITFYANIFNHTGIITTLAGARISNSGFTAGKSGDVIIYSTNAYINGIINTTGEPQNGLSLNYLSAGNAGNIFMNITNTTFVNAQIVSNGGNIFRWIDGSICWQYGVYSGFAGNITILSRNNLVINNNITSNGGNAFNYISGCNGGPYEVNASSGKNILLSSNSLYLNASLESKGGNASYANPANTATSFFAGNGGKIVINTTNFTTYEFAKINTNSGTYGNINSGQIYNNVSAGNIIIITNNSLLNINSYFSSIRIATNNSGTNGTINITKDYCSIQNATFSPAPNFTYRIAGCSLNITYAADKNKYHVGETVNITSGTIYFNDGYPASGYVANILFNNIFNKTITTDNNGAFNGNATIGVLTPGANTIGINISVPYVPISNVTNYAFDYWPYTHIDHLTQGETDDEIDVDDGFVNITTFFVRNDTQVQIPGNVTVIIGYGATNVSKNQSCNGNCTFSFTIGVELPTGTNDYNVTIFASNESGYYENSSATFQLRVRQANIGINLSNGMHLVNRVYPNQTITVIGKAQYNDGQNIGNKGLLILFDGTNINNQIIQNGSSQTTPTTFTIGGFNSQGSNFTNLIFDGSNSLSLNMTIFSTIYMANSTFNGNLSGRSGSDIICNSTYASNKPIGATKVHAFISISTDDSIKNMTINYGYNSNVPIYWYNKNTNLFTILAANWTAMSRSQTVPILNSQFTGTGDATDMVMTGSSYDLLTDTSGSCSEFTSSSAGVSLSLAFNSNSVIGSWISGGGSGCNIARGLRCIAEVTRYQSTGNYTSFVDIGYNTTVNWKNLSWQGIYPNGTNITIKVKSSASNITVPNFSTNTCNAIEQTINGTLTLNSTCANSTNKYLWYQIILNTDGINTPTINNITVNYDIQTNSTGDYAFIFNVPNSLGPKVLLLSLITNTSITGTNSTTFYVYAPTIVNHTTNGETDNEVDVDEDTITFNFSYYRTDTNQKIDMKNYNITISNTTHTIYSKAGINNVNGIETFIFGPEIPRNVADYNVTIMNEYESAPDYLEKYTETFVLKIRNVSISVNISNGLYNGNRTQPNTVLTVAGNAKYTDGTIIANNILTRTLDLANTNNIIIQNGSSQTTPTTFAIGGFNSQGSNFTNIVLDSSNRIGLNFSGRYTGIYALNKTYNGNLGGRLGADTLCNSTDSGNKSNGAKKIHAFLSIDTNDEIRDMPSNYGYNASAPIYWYNKATNIYTIINTNWTTMTTTGTLNPATVIGVNTLSTGSINDGSIGNNCGGFTLASGWMTYGTGSGGSWLMQGNALACDTVGYGSYLCAFEKDEYPASGNYTSFVDLGYNATVNWRNISWTGNYPTNTNVTIKTITSTSNVTTPNFASGTCDANAQTTDGTISLNTTCTNSTHRYLWYRITLNGDTGVTPLVNNITINYDIQTNSNGDYIYNLFAPNTSSLGVHTILLSLITNTTISGSNLTKFEVWAPTLVNYTFNYPNNYIDNLSNNFTVTAYYYRTDTNQSIAGQINITFDGYTNTCNSTTTCTAIFNTKHTLGIYNIQITAKNDSAYYETATNTSLTLQIVKLNTTIQTDNTIYNNNETITLTGSIRINNGTNIANITNTTYNIYIDGNLLNTSVIQPEYTINNLSLVGYYKFNKDSNYGENNTFVKDFSNYGNNGTIINATWSNSGKFKGTYNFDGIDEYVIINNPKYYDTKTISAYIYLKSNGSYEAIVSWSKTIGIMNYETSDFRILPNRSIEYIEGSTSTSPVSRSVTSTTLIPLNQWTHVTMTKNGTNVTLYINGNLTKSSTSFTATYNFIPLYQQIGAWTWLTANNAEAFNGSIDEVMIWNRSLSYNEINELYQKGILAYTDSTGLYNLTIPSPLTAGNHTIKINLTDANGIYGETSTSMITRIRLDQPNATSINNNNYTTINQNTNISVNLSNIGTDQIQNVTVEITKQYFTTTINVSKDVYIVSTAPDTNYVSSNLLLPKYNTQIALMYFNLSDIPANARIESAQLSYRTTVGSTPNNFTFYPLTGEWNETDVTWNNQPGYNININATINNTATGYTTHNISNIVQYQHDNNLNYGILLLPKINTDTQIYSRRHGSNQPAYITVTYSIPETQNLTGNQTGGVWSLLYNLNDILGTIRVKFFAFLQSGISEFLPTTVYYDVQKITLNHTITNEQYTSQKITITGNAYVNNGVTNTSVSNGQNITVYINGVYNGSTLTNNGIYNYNYTPNSVGQKTIVFNTTNQNGIYGETQNNITVYSYTKTNYTFNVLYIAGQSIFNITSYFYRNDTNTPINGNHTITINGTTQTCVATNNCNVLFYTPENITPETQTIYITANDTTNYYYTSNTSFNYRFETATGNPAKIANGKQLDNYDVAKNNSYFYNVTLINDNNAKIYNVSINYYSATSSTKIESVTKLTNNCINLSYNEECYETFNITIKPGVSVSETLETYWTFIWTNNNGIVSSDSNTYNSFTLPGTPNYTTTSKTNFINTTFGTTKLVIINITSTGNKNLLNINITNPNNALFTFYNHSSILYQYPEGTVFTGSGWTKLNFDKKLSLGINFTLTNYSYADYNYQFNVTLNPEGDSNNILNDSFNITLQVRPNMTTISSILLDTNLSKQRITDTTINITGNTPLTNITISMNNSNIPISWINITSTSNLFNPTTNSYQRLNESTNTNLRIIVNVKNNTLQNYSGLIKIQTNENIIRYINLTIIVAPQMNLNVSSLLFNQNHNTTLIQTIRINNTGNINITQFNLTFNSSQINTSFITITPNNLTNLNESKYSDFTIQSRIPEYFLAGLYNGTLIIKADNVLTQINLSINISVDNDWSFTTTYTQPVNFSLGTKGELANITIYNKGNIPLNFTLAFTTLSGSCIGAGTVWNNTKCIDYNYLNGSEASLTAYTYLPINSNRTLTIAQDIKSDDRITHNAQIQINISEQNANPTWNTTIVEFNILDQPPSMDSTSFEPTTKIVEMNKQINITTIVRDDIGINDSEFIINISKEGNIDSYLLTVFAKYNPNNDDVSEYHLEYNNTNVSGIYNVTIIAKDSTGKYSYFYYNFTVIGSTNLTFTNENITVYNITQTVSQSAQIPVNITNTGLVTAYNITVTGNFDSNATSFSYTQLNITNIDSNITNSSYVDIIIPEKTLPNTYYFTPIVTWINPNGSIQNLTFADIAIIVTATHQFNITNQNESLNIKHGTSQDTNFTLNATGNVNETVNITITQDSGLTVISNIQNILNLGQEQIITLTIAVQKYLEPLTRFFTINIFNQYFNATYTANVTTNANFDYTTDLQTAIDIQGVADVNTTTHTNDIWIKSEANVNMTFSFALTGNLTSFAYLNETTHTLTPGENYSVKIIHKSPKDNNYYYGNLSINGTYNYDINFYNHYYDLNILSVQKQTETLAGDIINVSVNIIYSPSYINENTTFVIEINNVPCTTTTVINNSNNIYNLQCVAPTLTDGITYQLNVKADYTDPSSVLIPGISESDNSGLNLAQIYYKDLTPPVLTFSSVTNGSLSTKINLTANVTDNVKVDKVIANIYSDTNTLVAQVQLDNISQIEYYKEYQMTSYGYFKVNFTTNDTTGNQKGYDNNNTFEISSNITWQGNTMNLVDKERPLVTFNLTSATNGDNINFATDILGNYSKTFKTDYYNTIMTMNNLLDFDGDKNISGIMYLNFSRSEFFDQTNLDFIDMYYITWLYTTSTDKIYKYPIRGVAINSKFNAKLNKIYIPFKPGDISKLDSHNIENITLTNLKIYYCDYWDYTPLTAQCLSNWTMLNTLVNGKLDSYGNYYATASYNKNINSSVAFILGGIKSNTPILSTDSEEFKVTINQTMNVVKDITVYSTGSTDLTNFAPICSGVACTFLNITPTNYPIISTEKNITVTTTVPKYTIPGNYTSTIRLTHNGGETNISFTVEVLGSSNCNATITNNTFKVGGLSSGELTNLTIVNDGNTLCNLNIATTANNITSTQTTVITNPNTTTIIPITYAAPHNIGIYKYNITLSNGQTPIPITLNVTHQVDIININEKLNVEENMTFILIAATNSTNGIEPNATWQVYIGNASCINTTYNNNTIRCNAPPISVTTTQTLKLIGTFKNGTAEDHVTVTYIDTIPPEIVNITEQVSLDTPKVNVTFIEDSGINNATTTVTIIVNGSTQTLNYTIKNNSLLVNMSGYEKNDYNLTITLTDNYGKSQTKSYIVELFQGVNISGVVDRNNVGVQTNFTFYRPNTKNIIHTIQTENNGSYSKIGFHNRSYDLNIQASNIEMFLSNITINGTTDILNLKKINFETDNVLIANPQGRAYDLMGYAGEAKFKGTGGNATLCYNPQDFSRTINIYNVHMLKCSNFDFQNMSCQGSWTDLAILERQVISNYKRCFVADAQGFSAYVLSEFETVNINPGNLAQVAGGGGGGGGGGKTSWKDGINQSEFNSTINALKDALAAVEKIGVDVSEINKELFPGEMSKGLIKIANDENETTEIQATLSGNAADLIRLDQKIITLKSKETRNLEFTVTIPTDIRLGTYAGELVLTQPKFVKRIPITIRVVEFKEQQLGFSIKPETNIIAPGKNLNVYTNIYNPTGNPINVTLILELINPDLDMTISTIKTNIKVDNFNTYTAVFEIDDNQKTGNYVIRGKAQYERQSKEFEIKDFQNIIIARPLLYKKIGPLMIYEWLIALLCSALIALAYIGGQRFVESRKRYHMQIELNEIPRNPGPRTAFLGNIAETNMRMFYDLDKLTTHTIVAGSTGSGKSISAQVLAEEALMKGVSVIVFDPTAQWSGFLRKQEEKNMLNLYTQFGMNKTQARPFNGNIHTINNARQKIDIKKYMIPGEIHVFTINKLDPKDIDIFVTNTVSEIFHANFEESATLKTIIIYDEVHRLLSKFGGSGEGFIQIERACREFRKWGIGVMLISQVLSDFVGQIKANINTEIQVKTKDEGDLERLRTKYSEELMKEVLKANVGTGMIQNAAYNKGRPFFVSFRPILHSTKRLSDEELSKYEKFNNIIDEYDYQLEQLKELNIDVFDIKIELGLAIKKLKAGSFNMVQIYLDGISPKIDSLWKKTGKTPKKMVIELVKEETIQNEHKKAKIEREKHIAIQTAKEKGIILPEEKNVTKIEEKIIIPKQPKYIGKIEPRIELMKKDFEELKKVTESLKRNGKDTNIEDIQIKKIDSDISFLEQDLSEKEFDKMQTKIDKLRQELIKLNIPHKKEGK